MRNIKLKTYVRKGHNYLLLQNIKGENSFCGKQMDVSQMSYEKVKSIVRDLSSMKTWDDIRIIMQTCYNVDKRKFWNSKILEFFKARNYLMKTFNSLVKRENNLLRAIEDMDYQNWKQAGGEEISKFGAVLALNQLGKLYGIYPYDLKDKKYEEILLLLTMEKKKHDIEKRYNQIVKSQAK